MKGMLFSSSLIPKILDGTKTVTRRCEKSLKEINKEPDMWELLGQDISISTGIPYFVFNRIDYPEMKDITTRYHEGETVYLKEAWLPQESDSLAGGTEAIITYKDDEAKSVEYTLDADWWESHKLGVWKSPLFMPEWASRKKLLISHVSVERLQDITPEDCIREGIITQYDAPQAVYEFKKLWNSINSKHDYSWESNPWLPRYEFKGVQS